MMGARYASKAAMKREAIGKRPSFIETSYFGPEYKGDGEYIVVGPDPYRNRKWFATVTVQGGVIVKVK